MMSLSHGHCLRFPSVSWYGHAAVARRYRISLNSFLVVFLRCLYEACGRPSYLIDSFLLEICHSSSRFVLMIFFPDSESRAVSMFCLTPDALSHFSDQLVCLPSVSALRASVVCLFLAYSSSGGMPSSVYMAASGVLVSSPKAFRTMLLRIVCASLICPLVSQTSIPYVSWGMISPLMILRVVHVFRPPVWYRVVRALRL